MSHRALPLCLAVILCSAVNAQPGERTWQFDLKSPGTYRVQVEHALGDDHGFKPGVTKVIYAVTIGEETQSRELYLIANQPFVPLITDVATPQKMRVVIKGLSPAALQHTAVHAYDAMSVPPGEYFDPQKSAFREARAIRAILGQPADAIDLARTKLTIDKMIDPAVDVESNLRKLEAMAASIRALPEFGSTDAARLVALKKFVYEPGEWNEGRPFEYDLDDPLGTKINNKLLSTYVVSRKGNCVTMPLLVILLGQRLGIDLTAATAPKHILVKWKNEAGTWVNLEATSGANPARDVWIRQQMPMTDEAIANGVYMQPLTRTETAALMSTTLAEHYVERREYDKAIAIADLALESYPKDVGTMVLKAVAFGRLRRQEFMAKYPSPAQIPQTERGYFQYLSFNHQRWFEQAEALGWREETNEDEREYLQRTDQARRENAAK